MRKNRTLLIVIILLSLLCSCGKENVSSQTVENTETTPTNSPSLPAPSKGTIGILISDMDNKLSSDIEKGIEDLLKEKGYDFILMDSKGYRAADVLNMQDMLKEDILAVVYNPTSYEISGDVVRLATAKNIPVVTVGCAKGDSNNVSNISSDFYRIGERAGDTISRKYGNNRTSIAQIPCTVSTPETEKFVLGFNIVIQPQGNFTLRQLNLEEKAEVSSVSNIEKAIEDGIDSVIFTTNCEDAELAVKMADEKGVECPTIVTIGESDTINEFIEKGKPILTFKQNGEKMGKTAAEAILDHLNGKTVKDEILVDADIAMPVTFFEYPVVIRIA